MISGQENNLLCYHSAFQSYEKFPLGIIKGATS